MPDPVYHCMDCNRNFPIRAYIDRDMKKTGMKAHCPLCNGLNTGNAKTMNRTPATRSFPSINDPPSPGQISYIRGLGGDISKVKTKGEAGELISRLKKQKEDSN